MFGKKVKIKDYKFTFGRKNEDFHIFACFKYRSTIYVIYQEATDMGTLYYGTCHISGNILVALTLGKNDSVEVIQNFVTKLYNEEDLSAYQILSLAKVEKIEIISFNSFSLKEEVINKLIELTIPKDPEVEKKNDDEKKGHPVLYVLTFFGVCFCIVGLFVYFNRDSIFGHERKVVCTKPMPKKYNAKVTEDVILHFSKSKQLYLSTVADTITFSSRKDFDNFALTGEYYFVFKNVNSEDLTISSNYDKKQYIISYESLTPSTTDYFGPRDYNQVLEYYAAADYECKEEELE